MSSFAIFATLKVIVSSAADPVYQDPALRGRGPGRRLCEQWREPTT